MESVEYFNINNNSLIYYSRIGRLDIVNKLLASPQIKIDSKNRYDNTALIYASRHGYCKIVKKLLENKANCNIQGEEKKTALIWAARNIRVDIVKLLIDYKAHYHLEDIYQMSALRGAYDAKCSNCSFKNKQIIKILTDYENNQIRRSLLSACPYIYSDIVEIIIKFVVSMK